MFGSIQHHTKTLKIPRTHRTKRAHKTKPRAIHENCKLPARHYIHQKYFNIHEFYELQHFQRVYRFNFSIMVCCDAEMLCGSRDFDNSLNYFT